MAALVIASRNKGKIQEISTLLSGVGVNVEVLSLMDFPGAPIVVEDGGTFVDNALKKAVAIREYTGLTSLADDSGLEVDYLAGRPGVHSARFAGDGASDEDNNWKLLNLLKGVPKELRTARFRCSIAIVNRLGQTEIVEGSVDGQILASKRGSGGFGYDPLFWLPEKGATFAELSGKEKNKISHRGEALRGVLAVLLDWQAKGLI